MKRLSVFIFVVMLMGACSPSVNVSMDYDKQVDFTKFKTYAYSNESQSVPLDDLNKRRLFTYVDEQMAAKGFTKSENSFDLLVDLQITAQQRQEAYTNSTGGYGYRWGGGMSTTTVQTYVDGTLIISFVEPNKKELVWQGRGTRELDKDATADKREKNIHDLVVQILAKYPPGAPKKY